MIEQQLRHFRLSLIDGNPERLSERRSFFRQTGIGAVIEKQLNHFEIIATGRRRDRSAVRAVVEIGQRRISEQRVFHVVAIPKNRCDVDIVSSASSEEDVDEIAGMCIGALT